MAGLLHELLEESARRFPDRIAVRCGELSLSYADLEELSSRVAVALQDRGAGPGERVGIYVDKSLASIVSVFAVLKTGGCYVPLDPTAPAQRLNYVIRNSGMVALLTTSSKLRTTPASILSDDSSLGRILLIECDGGPASDPPTAAPRVEIVSWQDVIGASFSPPRQPQITEADTAYILYTSGSTGVPKGVMISHRNSLAFVEWAADYVRLTAEDRVSNHAPLHFDLSIFDIFGACRAGATMVLVPERSATFPVQLTRLIERERISVWYSVPSVLTLLVLYGNLEAHNLSGLRAIIFAGEVFPTKYLRQLMGALPDRRHLNWYGPTETNVCTCYEVKPEDVHGQTPVLIGSACSGDEVFALDEAGQVVTNLGETGELYVRGPSVMQGYWKDEAKSAAVLVSDPLQPDSPEPVYRTGDLVTLEANENYRYLGRRDGMVKTRGYRVELGEIETVLHDHPAVKEVAVLPVPDEVLGNRLRAVISLHEPGGLSRDGVIAHCGERLPAYMVPDMVEFEDALPKTSTGKTDRVRLAQRPTATSPGA